MSLGKPLRKLELLHYQPGYTTRKVHMQCRREEAAGGYKEVEFDFLCWSLEL